MSAFDSKYVLLLSKSMFPVLSKLPSSRVPLRLLGHLCAMFMNFEKKFRHCYNSRRRLTVACLLRTSAGTDDSVSGNSCLARLVGLLLHWMSPIYRSSMFAFSLARLLFLFFLILLFLLVVISYIFVGLFLPSSECSIPEIGQPLLLYVPVLAHIGSRTLGFRESKFQPDSARKRSHNLHETYQLPSVQ